MRLPFPERLSLLPVLGSCLVLCLLQQLQGTTGLFSACTAGFILLATLAFNVTGGLTRPSGGFLFGYAVIGVIFGVMYKVVVGEPGQSNLLQPELTMELYGASMGAMLVATYLAKRCRLKKSSLPRFASDGDMYRSCVGCLLVGAGLVTVLTLRSGAPTPGSLLAALNQLNAFVPLSILLGVTYEIRRSGGRRSVNAVVVAAMLLEFADGVFNYSKEGMILPFVCWLIPAAAQRYRVNILQIAGMAAAFLLVVYYLVPYSQYGRNYRVQGAPFEEKLKTNLALLSNLEQVRKAYVQAEETLSAEEGLLRYYNKPQGLADRVQMITPDDAVINLTENGAVFGVFPTLFSFENLIPHFLWPAKPSIGFGNTYAHELGMVGDEDITTGIAFSPTGDAYHQAKWVGVLAILPLLTFLLFFTIDSVCGDTRVSPFPLLAMLEYLHEAPEGGTLQFAPEAFYGVLQIVLVAFLATKVMPLVANLVLGPAKERVRPVVIASITRRPVSAGAGEA